MQNRLAGTSLPQCSQVLSAMLGDRNRRTHERRLPMWTTVRSGPLNAVGSAEAHWCIALMDGRAGRSARGRHRSDYGMLGMRQRGFLDCDRDGRRASERHRTTRAAIATQRSGVAGPVVTAASSRLEPLITSRTGLLLAHEGSRQTLA